MPLPKPSYAPDGPEHDKPDIQHTKQEHRLYCYNSSVNQADLQPCDEIHQNHGKALGIYDFRCTQVFNIMSAVKPCKKEKLCRIDENQHCRSLFIQKACRKVIAVKQKPDYHKQQCHTQYICKNIQYKFEFIFSSYISHKIPSNA